MTALILAFQFHTCLRINEVLQLEYKDILPKNRIQVKGKRKSIQYEAIRIVPLTLPAQLILDYAKSFGLKKPFEIPYTTIINKLKKYNFKTHTARKLGISNLRDKGIPIALRALMAGQTELVQEKHYLQSAKLEDLERALSVTGFVNNNSQ